MPSRKQNPSFDRAAAAAMFADILEELRSGGDIERLNECRALFRRAVPLHLRSYAAAALILRALDSRTGPSRSSPQEGRRDRSPDSTRADSAHANRGKPTQAGKRQLVSSDVIEAPPLRPQNAKPARQRDEPAKKEADDRPEPRIKEGRYRGEGVTVFLGMGRRQRFNAKSIFRLLSDRTDLSESQVGEIRGRDNYTFLVLAPEIVESAIALLDGSMVKGRRLAVSLARKKEERPAGDLPETAGPVESRVEAAAEAAIDATEDDAAYDMGAYSDDSSGDIDASAGAEERPEDEDSGEA